MQNGSGKGNPRSTTRLNKPAEGIFFYCAEIETFSSLILGFSEMKGDIF